MPRSDRHTTIVATGPPCARHALMRDIRPASAKGCIDLNALAGVPGGIVPDGMVLDCAAAEQDGRVALAVEMAGSDTCEALAPALSRRHPMLAVACHVWGQEWDAACAVSTYHAGALEEVAAFSHEEAAWLPREGGDPLTVRFHSGTPAHERAAAAFLGDGALGLAMAGGQALGGGWRLHGPDPAGQADSLLLVRPSLPGDPLPGGTAIRLEAAAAEWLERCNGVACATVRPEGFVLMRGVSPTGGYASAVRTGVGDLAAEWPGIAPALAQGMRACLVARQRQARLAAAWREAGRRGRAWAQGNIGEAPS